MGCTANAWGSTSHGTSNDLSQPKTGSPDCEMHGDENLHEANDLLATADTDNGPHGASLPHKRAGQLSEHVEASAPQLRRQVNDIDPQEHGEPQAHDSCDAPETYGELQTHMSSEVTQVTPLVVPETCHPAMDNMEITATSQTTQQEYHSMMSRDETLMPRPRAMFPQVGQPSAKGKA